MLPNVYNRFDSAKGYDQHLFRADRILQSAELNEVQSNIFDRLGKVASALFKDGDIVSDCTCIVDKDTGQTMIAGGQIYLAGAVRSISGANFIVPNVGSVAIGVYQVASTIDEIDDPELLNPAVGTRGYMEPGAARLKLTHTWGFVGDGQPGTFFPVYEVTDGNLAAKSAPPQLDSVTQALARYDRESAGGTYVVSGLSVQKLADSNGQQVYSIAEGSARVRGFSVEFSTSTRFLFDPAPDYRFISAEPHLSTTANEQTITLDYSPAANVTEAQITAERTVTLTHGAYSGVSDPLPDTSILSIEQVRQGATVYTKDTDYKLTSGKVDWSPAGAEPATGSSYEVTYRYIKTILTPASTETTVTVSDAVPGTLVFVSYNQMLPRLDKLCVTDEGVITLIKGVAADYNPRYPDVPSNMLAIATIYQTWTASRRVVQDGIRVVPMNDLVTMSKRIDYAISMIAQQQLESDVNFRETGAKKGMFTDPFIDDSQRDQGREQTAAVFNGEMMLPVYGEILACDNRGPAGVSYLDMTATPSVQQLARTGSMKVNPYMAFGLMPAQVTLNPSIDRWADVQTSWTSPVTRTVVVAFFSLGLLTRVDSTSVNSELLNTQTVLQSNLRQIWVEFTISGFGPGENLSKVTFDGLEVQPVNL